MPSAYDDILPDIYESCAVPLVFEAPARVLVAESGIRPGYTVLDVGTGTGIVARLASRIVGARGLVIGLDASRVMLSAHTSPRSHKIVLGRAPHFPFPESTFDVVTASFVIHHVSDYSATLAAMASLLVVDGRIGLSAWKKDPPELVGVWNRATAGFVNLNDIVAAASKTIPFGDHFAVPENLAVALSGVGLNNVQITETSALVKCTPEQYVTRRGVARKGTLVRMALGPDRWSRFLESAQTALEREFGSRIEYASRALIGTGVR